MKYSIFSGILIYVIVGMLSAMFFIWKDKKDIEEQHNNITFLNFKKFFLIASIIIWPVMLFIQLSIWLTKFYHHISERILIYKSKNQVVKILERILKDNPENDNVKDSLNKLKKQ